MSKKEGAPKGRNVCHVVCLSIFPCFRFAALFPFSNHQLASLPVSFGGEEEDSCVPDIVVYARNANRTI